MKRHVRQSCSPLLMRILLPFAAVLLFALFSSCGSESEEIFQTSPPEPSLSPSPSPSPLPSPGTDTWYFYSNMTSLTEIMGARYLIPEYFPEPVAESVVNGGIWGVKTMLFKSQFIHRSEDRSELYSPDNLTQYAILYEEWYPSIEELAPIAPDEVRITHFGIETLDNRYESERTFWPPLGGYERVPDGADTQTVTVNGCPVSMCYLYSYLCPFLVIAEFSYDHIPYNVNIGMHMGDNVREEVLLEFAVCELTKVLESMIPNNE